MNNLVSALHDTTHRVPGVPEHHDRPRGHHGQSLQDPSLHRRDTALRHAAREHHHNPPRVMVGWQNWIASLFTRKTH